VRVSECAVVVIHEGNTLVRACACACTCVCVYVYVCVRACVCVGVWCWGKPCVELTGQPSLGKRGAQIEQR
jgi:hypothetical protein